MPAEEGWLAEARILMLVDVGIAYDGKDGGADEDPSRVCWIFVM